MRLGLWGAKSLGPPAEGDFISCSALMLALRAEFHPEKARGRDLRTELRLGDEVLRVVVRQGELSFTVEPFAEPHLTLEAAPHLFVQVFTGYATLDDAVASGQMQVDGSLEDARSFFEIFQMAVPAEAAR
jgi:putative sterol carrier protein